jgi:hypothetical protein
MTLRLAKLQEKKLKREIRRIWKVVEEMTVPVRYRFRTGCGAEESEGIYL